MVPTVSGTGELHPRRRKRTDTKTNLLMRTIRSSTFSIPPGAIEVKEIFQGDYTTRWTKSQEILLGLEAGQESRVAEK
jgi:hypothetical protein